MKAMEITTPKHPNNNNNNNNNNIISPSWNHYKNVVVVSALSMLFIVTYSFSTKVVVVDDTSTLLQHLPMTTALLGILLGMVLVKCSFIATIGYKFSFTLSVIGIVVSLLFHFKPTLTLLTFAAFCEGFCWIVLSVSIASYVTQLAYDRSAIKRKNQQRTSQYLAIPYFFFKLSELATQVFDRVMFTRNNGESPNIPGGGNITLFTTITTTTTTTTAATITAAPYFYQQCPSYFTFTESITSFTHHNVSLIEPSLNNIIIGASGAFCCFAVAGIHHVVDSQDNLYHCEARTRSTCYNLTSSLYLFKNKTLLFLLPTTFYLGMTQAFIYYKILKMAVICEDWSLEFSLFAYTVTCCITSIVYHKVIAKKLYSQHIVPCVLLLHALVLASMLLNVNLPKFFPFVEAIVFGVCDPILFCHVKGVYGTLCESKVESTYAIFEAAQKVGFYLFHVLLAFTSGYEQVIILLSVQGLSVITFFYGSRVAERKRTLHRFDIPYFL